MRPGAWIERLQSLAARFPELGFTPDLATLSAADLWGVYRFPSRVGDAA